MFYEQNVKHYYLTNTIDGGRYQTDQSKMILQQAFENYESAWNMNLANDFLRLAQNQTSNLTYIDYDIVSQKIMIMNEPVTETHDDFPEKSRETRHKRTSINLVEQDPKCKTRPYHHERDSVWKTYDKY